MTIKEYDLSEGIVSDEKLGKWFGEAGFGTATIITRENVYGIAVIHVANSRYSMQINSRCNLFTCMGVNISADTWGVVHPENEVQLMEELFNSQWCDLKVESPEEGQQIVARFKDKDTDSIIFINVGYSALIFKYFDNFIGWILAENIVI